MLPFHFSASPLPATNWGPTFEAAKASSSCCSPAWHNGQLRVDLEGWLRRADNNVSTCPENPGFDKKCLFYKKTRNLKALRLLDKYFIIYIHIYIYYIFIVLHISLHIYLRMDDWKKFSRFYSRFLGGCKCRNCSNIDGSLWQIPLTSIHLHYPPFIQPFARSSALDPWKH